MKVKENFGRDAGRERERDGRKGSHELKNFVLQFLCAAGCFPTLDQFAR